MFKKSFDNHTVLVYDNRALRMWRNWQTRTVQVRMIAMSCRFKSCHPHQIRNSRLIQSYRPTVFFLSLNISRKSLIYKGFFAFVVHFGICGAYMLYLECLRMQKSTATVNMQLFPIVKRFVFVKPRWSSPWGSRKRQLTVDTFFCLKPWLSVHRCDIIM